MIVPSGCTATTLTVLSASGLKVISTVPSALIRAMRLRVVAIVAPLGCSEVKTPPMSALPSGCTEMENGAALGFGL